MRSLNARTLRLLVVALVALIAAGQALADSISLQASPYIVGAGDINNVSLYGTPRGVGYDGVGGLIVSTTAGNFLCSGSLLQGGRYVLTAAHCVTDDFGNKNVTSGTVTFFPNPTGTEVIPFDLSRISVHPLWTGDYFQAGYDIAVIGLAATASAGVERYDLFTGPGDVGSDYNVAGFGRRGSFGLGATLSSGSRRQGDNTFDLAGIPSEGISSNILLSDFDNGLALNDLLSYFGAPHLGLGINEVSTAPGDSGGPAFIGGKIAGITSFGATAGPPIDIDSALNSSFGELNGFTRVTAYEAWVQSVIPEPGTWASLGSFLAIALAGVMRRRKAS
jgi:hypothetical protein